MVKSEFFWNTYKTIDIWILCKEQNLFRSEFYMCVPNVVKFDWDMAAKNPRFFWHFNFRPRWFPAHHRDRHVDLVYFFLFSIKSATDEVPPVVCNNCEDTTRLSNLVFSHSTTRELNLSSDVSTNTTKRDSADICLFLRVFHQEEDDRPVVQTNV